MNRLAIWAVFALITAAAPLNAAQTGNQPDEQDMKALATANWFVPLSYGNVDFEIPAGSIVEKNSTMLVKYPDGTFGVSMANEDGRLEQKIAFEKARMYATQYNLVDPKIEKVTISGLKGAKAVGQLDSHTVTVLILPVDDQQLTTVVMATPERKGWSDHFIDSLKH
jgi:hypothetical protein